MGAEENRKKNPALRLLQRGEQNKPYHQKHMGHTGSAQQEHSRTVGLYSSDLQSLTIMLGFSVPLSILS